MRVVGSCGYDAGGRSSLSPAGLDNRGCEVEETIGHVVESRELRALAGSEPIEIEELTEHDCEPEHRQRAIEAEISDVDARAPGIGVEDLDTTRKPRGRARHLAEHVHDGVIIGLGPVAQQDGEVVQRTPPRAHVPIDHRDRREALRVEQHVVELEVVVHERHRALGHDVVLEPRDDAPDQAARLLVVGEMRTLRPARDLAGKEPVRAAEGVEIHGAGVDAVQTGERVHELGGNLRRLSRLPDEGGWKLGPDGNPRTILHEEERRAQDRGVLAKMERTRRQRKLAPEA